MALKEGVSLYLKYRPSCVKDIFSDDVFLKTIKLLQEMEDLQIMFIGTSNCGKTTLLYALIYEYYDLKRHQKIPETNILFINNLKDQGINYFRNEMKTFSQTKSTVFGKKKMIVIDDIDWINEQCQQVIRNYLDKYKENIHFLCVCTNPNKVIESLQSRLHLIEIPKESKDCIKRKIEGIVDIESISITEESIDYLMRYSGYSIRNILNYLEKMLLLDIEITLEICKITYMHISVDEFEAYLRFLKEEKDIKKAVLVLYGFVENGYSVIDIYDFFFHYLKNISEVPFLEERMKYDIIKCLCFYIQQFNTIHEDQVELVFFTKKIYDIFSKYDTDIDTIPPTLLHILEK
jgi:DNA polymerase III delta prime subunit